MQTFVQVKVIREPGTRTQESLLIQAAVDSSEWLLGPEESGLSTTELVKILDFFFLNTQENLRTENLVNVKHMEQW